MENGSVDLNGEEPRDPESDEEKDVKTGKDGSSSGGHKRTLSGSILSKLSFLRSSTDSSDLKHDGSSSNSHSHRSSMPHKSAMVSAVEQRTTRKRKGSLRKTAILGSGRPKVDSRDRKNSNLEPLKTARTYVADGPTSPEDIISPESPLSPEELPTPRPSIDRTRSSNTSSELAHSDTGLSTASTSSTRSNDSEPPMGGITRTSTYNELSTTDDDEAVMFLRNPILTTSTTLPKKPSQQTDSYFPVESRTTLHLTQQRRRSSQKSKSPLSTSLSSLPPNGPTSAEEDLEWDYSPTVRWGYIILLATWLVFTVGMGSCFEVWSWAWDVGETPYAPPELEDDPTLPIVGYYPALMVLTGVMAWVWVIVAWVGMKYFRHARIPDV